MSAWIVSKAHIDLLVHALTITELVAESPDKIGRALWAENLASVAYRYPGDGNGERPGPMDFDDSDVETYTFAPVIAYRADHAAWKTAAGCYDYQSCEHSGWESSTSHEWIDALDAALEARGVVGLPGNYPWGFEEEHVRPVGVSAAA